MSFFRCVSFSKSARGPIVTFVSQAIKDVRAGQKAQNTLLVNFERIELFFRRLEVHTQVEPTSEMTDMMAQISVEVISILGITTKEIKQGRTSE